MSRHSIFEIHATECQCDRCTPDQGAESDRFLAHRSDIYRAAHALMKDLWDEDTMSPPDVYMIAEFLAGDSMPGGGVSARAMVEVDDEDDDE